MNKLLIHKFNAALPDIQKWLAMTLAENQNQAIKVIDCHFPRIVKVLPTELLTRVKLVLTTDAVPFPPLSRMGLSEFSAFEQMAAAGLTLQDTLFIDRQQYSESICFHELVHVIQWDTLGANFLLAYGAGLIEFGYRDCPLEQMAYHLQDDFERGTLVNDVVELIRQETQAIWNDLKQQL